MPYKVTVTRMDGSRSDVPDIHRTITPQKNEIVEIEIKSTTIRAAVTRVCTYASKSPGTAGETVDDVYATEIS